MADLTGFLAVEVRRRIQASTFSVVSEASGIDRATLHKLSRGKLRLTVETAQRAAAFLGYELRLVKNVRKA